MTQNKPCIERNEVKKLAHISQLAPTEAEIGAAVTVLDARLSYITILQDLVAGKVQQTGINVVGNVIDLVTGGTDVDVILSYLTMPQDLAAGKGQQAGISNLHNVMRDDVVKVTDADTILALAPQSEAHYFVVPVIIKQNS